MLLQSTQKVAIKKKENEGRFFQLYMVTLSFSWIHQSPTFPGIEKDALLNSSLKEEKGGGFFWGGGPQLYLYILYITIFPCLGSTYC